jgi:hypothetical protein
VCEGCLSSPTLWPIFVEWQCWCNRHCCWCPRFGAVCCERGGQVQLLGLHVHFAAVLSVCVSSLECCALSLRAQELHMAVSCLVPCLIAGASLFLCESAWPHTSAANPRREKARMHEGWVLLGALQLVAVGCICSCPLVAMDKRLAHWGRLLLPVKHVQSCNIIWKHHYHWLASNLHYVQQGTAMQGCCLKYAVCNALISGRQPRNPAAWAVSSYLRTTACKPPCCGVPCSCELPHQFIRPPHTLTSLPGVLLPPPHTLTSLPGVLLPLP